MNTQTRIYLTLSPRIRRALELCATLDGSTPSSYGAIVLSDALMQEIERNPVLLEHWRELEREALRQGSWDVSPLSSSDKLTDKISTRSQQTRIEGWFRSGTSAKQYEIGVDTEALFQGKKSAYLRSKESDIEGFGSMMQTFDAEAYRGKRMQFSAYVKSEGVEDWAGLWMRVDGAAQMSLAFDNMQDRSIKGTTDWQRYSIVLNIPEKSVSITLGILLQGQGQVWINDVQFTEVSQNIAVTSTDRSYSNLPRNLDFEA